MNSSKRPNLAIFCTRNPYNNDSLGHLLLGGVDEQYFEGDLVWSNINSQDEWQVGLN